MLAQPGKWVQFNPTRTPDGEYKFDFEPDKCFCILTGLNKVYASSPEFVCPSPSTILVPAYHRVATAIGLVNCYVTSGIAIWNDEPGRTLDEVLRVLDAAAEIKEEP